MNSGGLQTGEDPAKITTRGKKGMSDMSGVSLSREPGANGTDHDQGRRETPRRDHGWEIHNFRDSLT